MSPRTRRVLLLVTLLLALLTAGTAVNAEEYDFDYIYVSIAIPGTTEDGLAYDSNDIIGSAGLGQPWFTFFDGDDHGLSDHVLNAFDFDEVEIAGDTVAPYSPIYMSFARNRFRIPDIPGWVYAHDVVKFTPDAGDGSYELYFDGSDVGLTTVDERSDALAVWTAEDIGPFDVPDDCSAGILFMSTMSRYRVPAAGGGSLTGPGGDILVFCATNLGPDTAGFWYRAFNATAEGFAPSRVIRSLSIHDFVGGPDVADWEMTFSFISRIDFTVDAFDGVANTIYLYNTEDGILQTMLDMNYDYPKLNGQATGLMIDLYPLVCANVC